MKEAEAGFALVVALLALVALSTIATAGWFVSGSERTISRNHRSTVEAREIARAGISEYLAASSEPPARQVFTYGEDTARVTAERLVYVEPDSSVALIRLTSRGVVVRGAAEPNAERTVSTVVIHDRGRLVAAGALTSAAGASVRSADVAVSGHNACSGDPGAGGTLYGDGGGGAAGATAGVAVPPGGFDGAEASLRGDPPIDETRTGKALLRASGIDSATWAGLENGTLVEPDAEVPPGAWPSGRENPVILVEGPFTLDGTHSGQGTIIATGPLTIEGTFTWDGLVLAGGAITSTGSGAVRGGVIAGLDVLHGASPATSDLGGGFTVDYHVCELWKASRKLFGSLIEEPGTWYETM